MKIGSILENQNIEKRIAITPEIVKKYISLGFEVSLSENYGYHIGIKDEYYKDMGDNISKNEEEVLRINAAAEDAALLEAMGALSEEEDNLESLNSLDLSEENIQKLTAAGINNKDDLAELAVDELVDIIEISNEEASNTVMKLSLIHI